MQHVRRSWDSHEWELFNLPLHFDRKCLIYHFKPFNILSIGCLSIHETHVNANNVVFFSVSDLKIVYYNNYLSSTTMLWTRDILHYYLFGDKIIQNCKQNFAGNLTFIPRKAKFIFEYTNFQPQGQLTTSTRRQQISDLAGSWLQDVLTMLMWWEILLEGVGKIPLKTFSRTWSFTSTFDPCEVIWLIFKTQMRDARLFVCLFGFYGISTFLGYFLMPSPNILTNSFISNNSV